MPLYDLPSMSAWEGVRMCVFATATGDMIFMLVIYLTLAAVHSDLAWPEARPAYTHAATWLIPLVIGSLLAVSYELWAVYVEQRWSYADAMPRVPVVEVGILPLLQMIIIPFVMLLICARFAVRS
jgi:L-cystine uptake protein TcyP (sodium:dicarboxylate symporter family)